MKRIFSSAMFVLLLTSMLFLAFNIQPAKANGTIYVRADGSIDPSTAPISTIDNVTYTLTGNITSDADGIVIERDNIVLDGAGYTVQGIGSTWMVVGVSLTGRSNDTVENVNVKGFGDGIKLYLCYVGNNSIVGNNITNNGHGIYSQTVYNNNRISGNNITNNDDGIWFWHSSNNSINRNNIKANEWNGIYLRSSQNNTIVENDIADNRIGIGTEWEKFDIYSVHNKIYNNNFVNNSQQVNMFEPVPNVWSGNYWSDYKGTDANQDGIGDTPYIIDINNADNHPLMNIIPEFPSILILSLLMITTLLAVIVCKRKHSI